MRVVTVPCLGAVSERVNDFETPAERIYCRAAVQSRGQGGQQGATTDRQKGLTQP